MRLALISDTHDDLQKIDHAVKIIKQEKVELTLHLGDWCAPFSVLHFKGVNLKSVLGNNDGDVLLLEKAIKEIKGELLGEFASLNIEGKKMALFHGKYPEIVEAIAKSNLYDFLFFGHTHIKIDQKLGKIRLINPGEDSLAILETKTASLKFVKIKS